MSTPVTTAPIDPNVRNKIVMSLAMKFAQSKTRFEEAGLKTLVINTKIGQPSFASRDLPVVRITLTSEQVDQYLTTNLFKDTRECSLLVSVITDRITTNDQVCYFTKSNIKEGVPYVENITRLIGTLMLEHENEMQPKEVVWAQFAGRDLSIADTADPKTITSTLTYQIRYTLDLNHPYYALAYSLPEVPPASFE